MLWQVWLLFPGAHSARLSLLNVIITQISIDLLILFRSASNIPTKRKEKHNKQIINAEMQKEKTKRTPASTQHKNDKAESNKRKIVPKHEYKFSCVFGKNGRKAEAK
jgi:hypothetical protein